MREARFKETEIGTIPEDWAIDTLGSNVDKIFCGRDPSGGKQSHSNERTQYRIIQSAPVFDGYLNNEKVGNISKEMYHNLESASLRENDVLLNQLGDGITFARSCVVSREVLPAIITRSVGCIRCNQQKLDPWFLNAFLILPKTKKYIESFNSGSSRRAIDGGKMRSFLIPIPPIEEQRKIGFFYKTIQSKLELNRSMNSTLEAIGQALFRRWFVDFEFPNEEGKPYRSSGGEMVDTELGEVPKGWEVCPLGDNLSMLKDGSHNPPKRIKEGIRFIAGASDIRHFIINFDNCTYITKTDYEMIHKKWFIQPDDILLTIVGTVGNVAKMRNVDQLVYKLYDLTLKRSLRISIRGSKMNQKTRGSFKGKHDIIHKKSLSHRSNNLF